MHEVLAPNLKSITWEFHRGFDGMADRPIKLEDLFAAREAIIATIVGQMPDEHRRFLISFETGQPEWNLLDLRHVATLPAIAWRQANLKKTTKEKRAILIERLYEALSE